MNDFPPSFGEAVYLIVNLHDCYLQNKKIASYMLQLLQISWNKKWSILLL